MRVIIIGAGLGGLTLLHGLRAQGIDARVVERARLDGAQPASYGIHLNADGLGALRACLPRPNWQLVDAAGVPAPDVVRFRGPDLGLLAVLDRRSPGPADGSATRRAISRGRLRNALLHGTDQEVDAEPLVHWGRTCTGYRETPTTVRALFDDGSSLDGDLLVGADGSNSVVRRRRLPELRRRDLGITNIAGRVPLTPGLAAALPADLLDGGVDNVVPAGSGWLFVSSWDTGDPDVRDVSRGATRYLVWAWAGAQRSYPGDLGAMGGAELKHLVQQRTARWAWPLRLMIDDTDPETVTAVPLRTMPPLPAWEPGPVTLLGDAVHNMTPMAGIGANTALRDADQLRLALHDHPADPIGAVGRYETAMRGYANRALALSTRNATNAALAGPANRAAFRTLLRLGTRIPRLQRRMFGPTDVRTPR